MNTLNDNGEEFLKLALDASSLDFWENDLVTGQITRKALRVFGELGYNEFEAASYVDDLFAIVHPSDVPYIKEAIQDHIAGKTPQYRCEFRLRAKNGIWVWYANYGKLVDRNGINKGHRFIGATLNIDDRKQQELALAKSNRALKLLSQASSILIRSKNEKVLLNAVCKLAVETGGYLMAWIGFAQHDDELSVQPVAKSGYEDGYLDGIKVTWSNSELGQGPTGTAIRTATAIVSLNTQSNPKMSPWQDAARQRGYQSSIAIPLIVDNLAIGAMTIYSGEAYTFDSAEVALLEEFVGNLSYGIQMLRVSVAHDAATKLLNQQSASLRESQQIAGLGSYVLDLSSGKWESSEVLDKLLGIDDSYPRTIEGWSELIHPDDRSMMTDYLENEVIGQHQSFNKEYRIINNDKRSVHWVHGRGRLDFDAQGHISSMHGTILDITARKMVEMKLRESDDKMRLFIRHTPAANAMFDRDMRYIAYSDRWLKDYNLSDHEIIGRSHYEIFPEIPNRWKEAHRSSLAGRVEKCEEDSFTRQDGSIEWLRWETRPWYTDTGDIGGIIIFTEVITGRKLAEDQLRLWGDSFDKAEFGLAMADATTNKFISVNPTFAKERGYNPKELIGKSIMTVFPADITDQVKNKISALDVSTHVTFESVHLCKDGRQFPVLLDITVIKSAEGVPLRRMAYVLNITERKKLEISLLKSEQEFRQLAEAMPQIVWACHADGLNYYFNQQWVEYTGLTLEESYGHGWNKPFHIDDQKRAWDAWQNAVANKGSYALDCRLRRADGEYFWWLVKGVPVLDETGKIIKWFGTCTDIHRLKLAEQAQRISATAFETQDSIVITDTGGNILKVNQAFTRITGYTEADVLGKNPYILSSGRHDASYYATMWNSIKTTGTWSGDIWNKRKNGEIYPAYLTITAVKDVSGNITNYVSSQTDISERQQMIDELNAANTQIEADNLTLTERVTERTAQLEYANKAKDSFLATMSHEIRTPLGGLMGMMELLHLSKLDDKQKDVLNAARESANGLLRIVNDILDWSKIEAGKLDLAPLPSTITQLLNGVRNTYDAIAGDKNLDLCIQVDHKLSATHLFDTLRMSQILNNLVSNAIKFTREGTIEIRAECVAQQGETETVRFSVKDSGIGITPEQQAKLFKQYAQGGADTARMYGGTGLGLAISHRLAQLMGGTLAVESTPNVGSTFSLTIELPIAKLEERRAQQQPINKPDRRQSKLDMGTLLADLHRVTVLIVDDHPINRMLLRQQLELLGIHVQVAESGIPALTLWQNRHFDMVITDCHMPEMDGYELTRKIREQEQHAGAKHTPIIAWTANVLTEEADRCNAAGIDDILTKPTEVNVLKEMIMKWLSQNQGLAADRSN